MILSKYRLYFKVLNNMNNRDNKKYLFKLISTSTAIIFVFIIIATITLGVYYIIQSNINIQRIASQYEVYDKEVYKKYGDKIIKILINTYNKDINQTNDNSIGALYQAVKQNNIKAVKFLLDNNINTEIYDTNNSTH